MGKLFILSAEEDDLETVEKLMDFIASTELVICTDIPSTSLRYRALCIDAACRQVFWQGKFIELTPMEFDVVPFACPTDWTGVLSKGNL